MKVTPTTVINYKAISVRLHSTNFDISISSAYSPGDHSDHKDRKAFWAKLRNYHAKQPSRTYQVIGIDANGHIGRDAPMPHVGNYGATKWTNNGLDLAEMTSSLQLTATNTIQSCADTTWTWQSRDGRARTRVDYILIPTKGLAKVIQNTGTVMWANMIRQGSAIDHRAVALFSKYSRMAKPTQKHRAALEQCP